MPEGSNIFESSIRKAVEKALGKENEESVRQCVNQVSDLLMISIRKMPTKDKLKEIITKKIETDEFI
ncbi:MAG: hypothetical protein M1481_03335 [Candidatus Thermoplasmatota archaeon]|nr:hypothetical protein [Candidatus Thermoplasmatota archaeon]MCL5963781.1 hypothetical protein [Candidatus Thermoplasmatota archaeon]